MSSAELAATAIVGQLVDAAAAAAAVVTEPVGAVEKVDDSFEDETIARNILTSVLDDVVSDDREDFAADDDASSAAAADDDASSAAAAACQPSESGTVVSHPVVDPIIDCLLIDARLSGPQRPNEESVRCERDVCDLVRATAAAAATSERDVGDLARAAATSDIGATEQGEAADVTALQCNGWPTTTSVAEIDAEETARRRDESLFESARDETKGDELQSEVSEGVSDANLLVAPVVAVPTPADGGNVSEIAAEPKRCGNGGGADAESAARQQQRETDTRRDIVDSIVASIQEKACGVGDNLQVVVDSSARDVNPIRHNTEETAAEMSRDVINPIIADLMLSIKSVRSDHSYGKPVEALSRDVVRPILDGIVSDNVLVDPVDPDQDVVVPIVNAVIAAAAAAEKAATATEKHVVARQQSPLGFRNEESDCADEGIVSDDAEDDDVLIANSAADVVLRDGRADAALMQKTIQSMLESGGGGGGSVARLANREEPLAKSTVNNIQEEESGINEAMRAQDQLPAFVSLAGDASAESAKPCPSRESRAIDLKISAEGAPIIANVTLNRPSSEGFKLYAMKRKGKQFPSVSESELEAILAQKWEALSQEKKLVFESWASQASVVGGGVGRSVSATKTKRSPTVKWAAPYREKRSQSGPVVAAVGSHGVATGIDQFTKDEYPKIQREHRDLPVGERFRLVFEKWGELRSAERAAYAQRANETNQTGNATPESERSASAGESSEAGALARVARSAPSDSAPDGVRAPASAAAEQAPAPAATPPPPPPPASLPIFRRSGEGKQPQVAKVTPYFSPQAPLSGSLSAYASPIASGADDDSAAAAAAVARLSSPQLDAEVESSFDSRDERERSSSPEIVEIVDEFRRGVGGGVGGVGAGQPSSASKPVLPPPADESSGPQPPAAKPSGLRLATFAVDPAGASSLNLMRPVTAQSWHPEEVPPQPQRSLPRIVKVFRPGNNWQAPPQPLPTTLTNTPPIAAPSNERVTAFDRIADDLSFKYFLSNPKGAPITPSGAAVGDHTVDYIIISSTKDIYIKLFIPVARMSALSTQTEFWRDVRIAFLPSHMRPTACRLTFANGNVMQAKLPLDNEATFCAIAAAATFALSTGRIRTVDKTCQSVHGRPFISHAIRTERVYTVDVQASSDSCLRPVFGHLKPAAEKASLTSDELELLRRETQRQLGILFRRAAKLKPSTDGTWPDVRAFDQTIYQNSQTPKHYFQHVAKVTYNEIRRRLIQDTFQPMLTVPNEYELFLESFGTEVHESWEADQRKKLPRPLLLLPPPQQQQQQPLPQVVVVQPPPTVQAVANQMQSQIGQQQQLPVITLAAAPQPPPPNSPNLPIVLRPAEPQQCPLIEPINPAQPCVIGQVFSAAAAASDGAGAAAAAVPPPPPENVAPQQMHQQTKEDQSKMRWQQRQQRQEERRQLQQQENILQKHRQQQPELRQLQNQDKLPQEALPPKQAEDPKAAQTYAGQKKRQPTSPVSAQAQPPAGADIPAVGVVGSAATPVDEEPPAAESRSVQCLLCTAQPARTFPAKSDKFYEHLAKDHFQKSIWGQLHKQLGVSANAVLGPGITVPCTYGFCREKLTSYSDLVVHVGVDHQVALYFLKSILSSGSIGNAFVTCPVKDCSFVLKSKPEDSSEAKKALNGARIKRMLLHLSQHALERFSREIALSQEILGLRKIQCPFSDCTFIEGEPNELVQHYAFDHCAAVDALSQFQLKIDFDSNSWNIFRDTIRQSGPYPCEVCPAAAAAAASKAPPTTSVVFCDKTPWLAHLALHYKGQLFDSLGGAAKTKGSLRCPHPQCKFEAALVDSLVLHYGVVHEKAVGVWRESSRLGLKPTVVELSEAVDMRLPAGKETAAKAADVNSAGAGVGHYVCPVCKRKFSAASLRSENADTLTFHIVIEHLKRELVAMLEKRRPFCPVEDCKDGSSDTAVVLKHLFTASRAAADAHKKAIANFIKKIHPDFNFRSCYRPQKATSGSAAPAGTEPQESLESAASDAFDSNIWVAFEQFCRRSAGSADPLCCRADVVSLFLAAAPRNRLISSYAEAKRAVDVIDGKRSSGGRVASEAAVVDTLNKLRVILGDGHPTDSSSPAAAATDEPRPDAEMMASSSAAPSKPTTDVAEDHEVVLLDDEDDDEDDVNSAPLITSPPRPSPQPAQSSAGKSNKTPVISNNAKTATPVLSSSSKMSFLCKRCAVEFPHVAHLRKHLKSSDHAGALVGCKFCPHSHELSSGAANLSEVVAALSLHTFGRNHIYNRYIFQTHKSLKQDKVRSYKEPPSGSFCEPCRQDVADLEAHMTSRSHTNNKTIVSAFIMFCDMREINPVTCDTADLLFFLEYFFPLSKTLGFSLHHVLAELNKVHDPVDGCDVITCSEVGEKMDDLIRLSTVQHFAYVCFICPFLAHSVSAMAEHGNTSAHKAAAKLRELNGSKKHVKCEACDKWFDRCADLQLHQNTVPHMKLLALLPKKKLVYEPSASSARGGGGGQSPLDRNNFCTLCKRGVAVSAESHVQEAQHQRRQEKADGYYAHCASLNVNPVSCSPPIIRDYLLNTLKLDPSSQKPALDFVMDTINHIHETVVPGGKPISDHPDLLAVVKPKPSADKRAPSPAPKPTLTQTARNKGAPSTTKTETIQQSSVNEESTKNQGAPTATTKLGIATQQSSVDEQSARNKGVQRTTTKTKLTRPPSANVVKEQAVRNKRVASPAAKQSSANDENVRNKSDQGPAPRAKTKLAEASSAGEHDVRNLLRTYNALKATKAGGDPKSAAKSAPPPPAEKASPYRPTLDEETAGKVASCRICSFKAQHATHLVYHLLHLHQWKVDRYIKSHEAEKIVCCHKCLKKCLNPLVFALHHDRHLVERNIECEICHEFYTSPAQLYQKDNCHRIFFPKVVKDDVDKAIVDIVTSQDPARGGAYGYIPEAKVPGASSNVDKTESPDRGSMKGRKRLSSGDEATVRAKKSRATPTRKDLEIDSNSGDNEEDMIDPEEANDSIIIDSSDGDDDKNDDGAATATAPPPSRAPSPDVAEEIRRRSAEAARQAISPPRDNAQRAAPLTPRDNGQRAAPLKDCSFSVSPRERNRAEVAFKRGSRLLLKTKTAAEASAAPAAQEPTESPSNTSAAHCGPDTVTAAKSAGSRVRLPSSSATSTVPAAGAAETAGARPTRRRASPTPGDSKRKLTSINDNSARVNQDDRGAQQEKPTAMNRKLATNIGPLSKKVKVEEASSKSARVLVERLSEDDVSDITESSSSSAAGAAAAAHPSSESGAKSSGSRPSTEARTKPSSSSGAKPPHQTTGKGRRAAAAVAGDASKEKIMIKPDAANNNAEIAAVNRANAGMTINKSKPRVAKTKPEVAKINGGVTIKPEVDKTKPDITDKPGMTRTKAGLPQNKPGPANVSGNKGQPVTKEMPKTQENAPPLKANLTSKAPPSVNPKVGARASKGGPKTAAIAAAAASKSEEKEAATASKAQQAPLQVVPEGKAAAASLVRGAARPKADAAASRPSSSIGPKSRSAPDAAAAPKVAAAAAAVPRPGAGVVDGSEQGASNGGGSSGTQAKTAAHAAARQTGKGGAAAAKPAKHPPKLVSTTAKTASAVAAGGNDGDSLESAAAAATAEGRRKRSSSGSSVQGSGAANAQPSEPSSASAAGDISLFCLECENCREPECTHLSHARKCVVGDLVRHYRATGHHRCQPVDSFVLPNFRVAVLDIAYHEKDDPKHSDRFLGNKIRKQMKKLAAAWSDSSDAWDYPQAKRCRKIGCSFETSVVFDMFRHIREAHLNEEK